MFLWYILVSFYWANVDIQVFFSAFAILGNCTNGREFERHVRVEGIAYFLPAFGWLVYVLVARNL